MLCRVRSTPAILHRSSLASVPWSKRHQLPSRCVPHMVESSSANTRAFDCSGLTQWCYAQAGIQIPRTSEAQHDAAAAAGNLLALDESKLLPGDILWKKGHVGIYVGNNTYIHAPKPGDVVRVATGISYFTHALRFS